MRRRHLYNYSRATWLHDEYGYLRSWAVIGLTLAAIAAMTAIVWWLVVKYGGGTCDPPNHWVYTGWHYRLAGKILVPMNDYACEG